MSKYLKVKARPGQSDFQNGNAITGLQLTLQHVNSKTAI